MSRPDAFTVRLVWERGLPVVGKDPSIYRRDKYGALMKRDEYGNHDHPHGWEIRHIVPIEFGGPDTLDNLRPLNWRGSAGRAKLPRWLLRVPLRPRQAH